MFKIVALTDRLGHKFTDKSLLEQALRHSSAGLPSNERLEFLGDAVLNFVITVFLYRHYPELQEGQLSRLRSNLVNGKELAKLAKGFNIGECLALGVGEKKSGGAERNSILADAFEAIIGAIYLDGGIEKTEQLILKWYHDRLSAIHLHEQRDPKTKLQELLQANKFPLPKYEIVKTEGAAHEQIFHLSCQVEGLTKVTFGSGSSRRQAEQDAAEKFLKNLHLKSISKR
jgi:ribonuclease III